MTKIQTQGRKILYFSRKHKQQIMSKEMASSNEEA